MLFALVLSSGMMLATRVASAQGEPDTLEEVLAAFSNSKTSVEDLAIYARQACERFDHGLSCYRMSQFAGMYPARFGDATVQFKYAERACALREKEGCSKAAYMLENGKGTAKDLPAALYKHHLACELGWSFSCRKKQALAPQVGQILVADNRQSATASPSPPARNPEDEFHTLRARLKQLTPVTAVGSRMCNDVVGRLRDDRGRHVGPVGEAWWKLYRAGSATQFTACNSMPVAFVRQIEAEQAANATAYTPAPATSTYSSCDSTCQRERTIRQNTPRRCYVSNGRRICNK